MFNLSKHKYKSEYFKNKAVGGVVFDSRKVKKGDIFIGMKGGFQNGSSFASKAIECGACIAVVDDKKYHDIGNNIFYIKNPLSIVAMIAKRKRKQYKGKIIGITGSCGKTTLKEVLHKVLSNNKIDAYKSYGNYNNRMGLLFCLASLDLKSKIAIFEIGMNKKGEIKELSKILKPDISVITNIYTSHIGHLSNKQKNIAKEKISIAKHTKSKILLPKDSDYIKYMESKVPKKIAKLYFDKNLENIKNFPLTGDHRKIAAKISIKLLKTLGYKVSSNSFYGIVYPKGRGNRHYTTINDRKVMIIDDSYNASFESVKCAIKEVGGIKCKGQKILIIGDMKEQGKLSEYFHSNIIKTVDKKMYLIGYGDIMKNKIDLFKGQKFYTNDQNEIVSHIKQIVKNDDSIILVKGANSLQMSDIIKKI